MNSLTLMGYYRGCLGDVGRLMGNETFTFLIDGVNGDGSDEWDVEKGFDEVVKIFEKFGFEVDEDEGTITENVDSDWDELWREMFA